jgi:hypothetical protein
MNLLKILTLKTKKTEAKSAMRRAKYHAKFKESEKLKTPYLEVL